MYIRSSSRLSLIERPMMRVCSDVMLGLGSLEGYAAYADAGMYDDGK